MLPNSDLVVGFVPFFETKVTVYLILSPTFGKMSFIGFTVTPTVDGPVTDTLYMDPAAPTLVSSRVYLTTFLSLNTTRE